MESGGLISSFAMLFRKWVMFNEFWVTWIQWFKGWVLDSYASNWRMLISFLLLLRQFHRWCLPSIPEFQSAVQMVNSSTSAWTTNNWKTKMYKGNTSKKYLKKWNLFSIYGLVASHIQKPTWRLYHKDCYCTYFSHILLKLLQAQTLDMKPGSQEAAVAKPLAASPIRDRRSEAFPGSSTVTGLLPSPKKNTWKLMFLVYGVHTHIYIYIRIYTENVDRVNIRYCKCSVYIHICMCIYIYNIYIPQWFYSSSSSSSGFGVIFRATQPLTLAEDSHRYQGSSYGHPRSIWSRAAVRVRNSRSDKGFSKKQHLERFLFHEN